VECTCSWLTNLQALETYFWSSKRVFLQSADTPSVPTTEDLGEVGRWKSRVGGISRDRREHVLVSKVDATAASWQSGQSTYQSTKMQAPKWVIQEYAEGVIIPRVVPFRGAWAK
jgi:hypothetical protein